MKIEMLILILPSFFNFSFFPSVTLIFKLPFVIKIYVLSILSGPFTHVSMYVFSVFLVEPEGKDVQKCLAAGKIRTL